MFRMWAGISLIVSALAAAETVAASDVGEIEAAMRAGRFSSAQAAARRLVDAAPENPNAWAYLGLAEASLDHSVEAIDAFEHAVALNPKDARSYRNLAL